MSGPYPCPIKSKILKENPTTDMSIYLYISMYVMYNILNIYDYIWIWREAMVEKHRLTLFQMKNLKLRGER